MPALAPRRAARTRRLVPSSTTRRGRLAATLIAGLAALLGTSAALAVDVTVSAASSLADALRELGPRFEAAHPGTHVLLNLGASDAVVSQVLQGAPVDVLATADEAAMDRADAARRLVPGTRRRAAGNTLVVVVPRTRGADLRALDDLAKPGVRRVAIGQPAGVPAGRYARGALEAAGLWATLAPRAVFAQNVRQALDWVARGEADAGFVYATDARTAEDRVRVAFPIVTATPIGYPIAVVTGGPATTEGRAFVEFVSSPAGQAVLARHGFARP